jgi:hypothetical protein
MNFNRWYGTLLAFLGGIILLFIYLTETFN